MIKIHARVTKEIEITEEQAERLVNYLCDSSGNNDISDVVNKFMKGENPGNYENGYAPNCWLYDDLYNQLPNGECKDYLIENYKGDGDFDL